MYSNTLSLSSSLDICCCCCCCCCCFFWGEREVVLFCFVFFFLSFGKRISILFVSFVSLGERMREVALTRPSLLEDHLPNPSRLVTILSGISSSQNFQLIKLSPPQIPSAKPHTHRSDPLHEPHYAKGTKSL